MTDLKLNADGDLDLTGGDISLISGAAEVAQRLYIRLSSWLGDWELDQTLGKDRALFEATPPDERLIEHHLKTIITDTTGVTRLVSYSQTVDGRLLNVEFEAYTDADAVVVGSIETAPPGSAAAFLINVATLQSEEL